MAKGEVAMQAENTANGDAAAGTAVPADATTGAATYGQQPQPAATKQKRLFFIDWLRTVLTVMVVVHHVWSSYKPNGGDDFWSGQKSKKEDIVVDTIMFWIVTGPSMQYAMCLFFLLAGYFTPGSYNRKGPLKHVYDRLIRLLIPVVVYSVLIMPLYLTVNKAAGIPTDSTSWLIPLNDMTYAEVWKFWYKQFFICAGPPWFIWCLFWFDIGYVLLCLLLETIQGRRSRRSTVKAAAAGTPSSDAASTGHTSREAPVEHVVVDVSDSKSDKVPNKNTAVEAVELQEYSVATMLVGMGLLILACTVVAFAAVMATYNSELAQGYDGFWILAPLMMFRPSWMGPNAISFILGCQAAKLNLLRKLPARMTFWCLGAAALWWPLMVVMPAYIYVPYSPEALWGTYPISGAMVGHILYRMFVSWTFSVVWGVGMLLLFRELFNHAPGTFGKQVIAGAYGAYIIHPLIIPLWGWALRELQLPFVTLAGFAIAASPLVVVSSWVVTALVRCIPGTKRVLG